MLGIAYASVGVVDLLVPQKEYFRGIIERPRKKLVVKDKNGEVVSTTEAYDPKIAYEKFIKSDPGKREKIALIQGYETLKLIKSDSKIRYIIFDAPQVLSKNKIKILDATAPDESHGIWRLIKLLPEVLSVEIKKDIAGFEYNAVEPKYSIRKILTEIDKLIPNAGTFNVLVARYVFGMVTNQQWAEKTSRLKSTIDEISYNIFMDWLNTYAPDALCQAYQDVIIHAPKIVKKFSEISEDMNESEKVLRVSKFSRIAKKACSTSSADIEDFYFLCQFLPPKCEYESKFLVPIPGYLKRYRLTYPLIPTDKKVISNKTM